jgi:nucleoid-associated protein
MVAVKHAVVHALVKDQHQAIEKSIIKDQTLNPNDDDVIKLVEGVVSAYGSRNNSAHYGVFREVGEGRGSFPDAYHSFASLTQASTTQQFLELTKVAMDELYRKADATPASSGGYMLFAEYSQGDTSFLIAAMVKQKEGLTLNEDLRPEALMQLDLKKLHQAARINLSRYHAYLAAAGEEKAELVYLSFISPHPGKGASGYFVTALGCQAGATSQRATDNLIKATNTFFKGREELSSKRYDFRSDLLAYLDEKREGGQFVKLSEVDALARKYLPADEPGVQDALSEELMAFLNGEENAIPSEFTLSETALNRHKQIRYKAENWQINFEKTALGETDTAEIFYDKDSKKLVLRNIPEDMRSVIEEELEARKLSEAD